jgi:hypothetical protein
VSDNLTQNLPEQVKVIGDVASVGVVVGTIINWLPAVAALFTIAWTVMRMVDEWPKFKATVRGWFRKK